MADYHGDGSLRAFVECEYDADGQGFEQRTFNDVGEATTWTRGEIHQGRKRLLECKGLLNEEQRQRMRERHYVRLTKAYPHLAEKLQVRWERAEEERARSAVE